MSYWTIIPPLIRPADLTPYYWLVQEIKLDNLSLKEIRALGVETPKPGQVVRVGSPLGTWAKAKTDGVDYRIRGVQMTGIDKKTGVRSCIVEVRTPTSEELEGWFAKTKLVNPGDSRQSV